MKKEAVKMACKTVRMKFDLTSKKDVKLPDQRSGLAGSRPVSLNNEEERCLKFQKKQERWSKNS